MIVSKGKAAVESFVRTFLQSFVPAVALVNFTTTDIAGVKIAILAAAGAGATAGLAAVARLFVPLSTDASGVGVEGVSSPRA